MSITKHNRNMIEQYVRMLRELKKEPLTKWRLQFRLESNYVTVNKLINIALTNNMIYRIERKYGLTPEGLTFAEGCKIV